MKTVRFTLDDDLLGALNEAATDGQEPRGAVIRTALRAEVKRRRNAKLEETHRRSFQAQPDVEVWQPGVRAWDD
ncbi:ribbon-helix-helix protein, CopG family [Deinococcus sp.]|uniref:ribbon-helix-helix protein, CopG family n=1 Tax=Deinococcus sp. TaxID=47478 RepID=UPI0025E61A2E|nr:ribbon-helix-helix protein, CopG family [Deinococcus sp.]